MTDEELAEELVSHFPGANENGAPVMFKHASLPNCIFLMPLTVHWLMKAMLQAKQTDPTAPAHLVAKEMLTLISNASVDIPLLDYAHELEVFQILQLLYRMDKKAAP